MLGNHVGRGPSRRRTNVKFEVEPSPAHTPSWKSNSWQTSDWNSGENGKEDRSPTLKKAGREEEAEWEEAGEQVTPLPSLCLQTQELSMIPLSPAPLPPFFFLVSFSSASVYSLYDLSWDTQMLLSASEQHSIRLHSIKGNICAGRPGLV